MWFIFSIRAWVMFSPVGRNYIMIFKNFVEPFKELTSRISDDGFGISEVFIEGQIRVEATKLRYRISACYITELKARR